MLKKDIKKGYLYNTSYGVVEVLELYPKSFKMRLIDGYFYLYDTKKKTVVYKYKNSIDHFVGKIGPKKQHKEYYL